MENGPVEIVTFPMKNGGSFHSYVAVYQRVPLVYPYTSIPIPCGIGTVQTKHDVQPGWIASRRELGSSELTSLEGIGKGRPVFFFRQRKTFGDVSKPWYLVNIKIAGKWMFIPLKMYL